ncbi:MAG: PAS domain S-box protein, partial [Acidobacteriota bacterium]|nr:PAS domain S-box protein [Acidobacteriota bacterium]
LGLDPLGRRKDGSLFPVEVSLSQLSTESEMLSVGFVTDISVRRQQEEELRRLRAEVLSAEEDVAREIARELHDDVTQRLAFIAMEMGKLASEQALEAHLAGRCRAFQNRIREVSEDIRQLSHRMHPAILDDLGLSAAIEDLCSEATNSGNLHVHFQPCEPCDRVDRMGASCLYRVCQECLSNVLKHAGADAVDVVLSEREGAVQLEVRDTGAGFNPETSGMGLGLYGMKERVRLAGGRISVESEPGQGTRVTVRVPLRRDPVGRRIESPASPQRP